MSTRCACLLALLCIFGALHLPAAVLYVNISSTNPVAPFSSWSTAATNIQDAVDASSSGDAVLVTNGVYQYGGRVMPGLVVTNRLIVTNAITVQSINGPLVTTIVGYQIPGDIAGPGTVRCVWLDNNASLAGFTVTQGGTLLGGDDGATPEQDTSGAGVLCPFGGSATVSNCIFISNIAGDFGGGIYFCTAYNCLVVSNTALVGSYGGGTFGGNYYNCTITANSADIGAGDAFGYVVNCIVDGNFAVHGGNCDYDTPIYCCTDGFPGNPGNVNADPLFVNPAAGNFRLQAASPCVNAGNNSYVSNVVDLAGNPRISGGTVDIGAYELQFHYADINSTNPVAPFSSWTTAATNIQDAVDAASNYDEVLVTNGVYRYGGRILSGNISSGFVLTNRLIVSNAVTVQSVNGPVNTVIEGSQVAGTIVGRSAVRCAYLAKGAELIGFTLTNGATYFGGTPESVNDSGSGCYCPSSNIATLVNCVISGNTAAARGGAYRCTLINCILSNNVSMQGIGGAYDCTLTNCSVISNIGGGMLLGTATSCLITGNSAGNGGGANSCTLNDCAVVNNIATNSGGGAYESAMNNCIVSGNSSFAGGGVYGNQAGTTPLNNCLIFSNSAFAGGGGVVGATLSNCTVAMNHANANQPGGVVECVLYNCIVFSNTAPSTLPPDWPNYDRSSAFNFSCTTPLPPGPGNITNDPLFVNPGAGDFHLQPNSPCINAGNNAFVSPASTDLDGNPRISGGTVDIGASEFQNPASLISYAWLDQFGFATDGSADFADPDHDGMNNYSEWLTGTDPTNPSSVLRLLNPVQSGTNIIVTWQSVTNQRYFLLRASDPQAPTYNIVALDIAGQSGTTSYTDTNFPPYNPNPHGPFYYRVAVVQVTDGGPQQILPWLPIPNFPPPPLTGN